MAHQWYLQHGGKQHGPMTSAQLKKLATDGKISPASQIRLGAEGAWGPASRVQGLFPAPPEVSLLDELDAIPPVAPPPAPPPIANLARVPMGTISAVKPVKTASANPLAGKLLGAIGLIFGVLALSTCWLPLLGGAIGWTGIVVGGIGLLLGIAGLTVSAMQGGAGLIFNVAAASASVVGLVLTTALMLFTPKPIEVVVAPPPPPVEQTPAPEPVKEPEPAPPPEPVWTDASQSIEMPPIKATIVAASVETMRLESADAATLARSKPEKKLRIRVTIENTSTDKIVAAPGWNGGGGGGGALGDVGKLLEGSQLGGQLSAATATAVLTDNIGNSYPQVPAIRLPAAQADLNPNPAVRPGEKMEKLIVFDPPLAAIEYLRLELPAAGFGGSEPLRFQIPKSLLTGL
jgi:hypothetical protein